MRILYLVAMAWACSSGGGTADDIEPAERGGSAGRGGPGGSAGTFIEPGGAGGEPSAGQGGEPSVAGWGGVAGAGGERQGAGGVSAGAAGQGGQGGAGSGWLTPCGDSAPESPNACTYLPDYPTCVLYPVAEGEPGTNGCTFRCESQEQETACAELGGYCAGALQFCEPVL